MTENRNEFILDTSALVKLYHKEIGSDNLKSILKKCKNDLVITISKIALSGNAFSVL